jgi:hypothetical protein
MKKIAATLCLLVTAAAAFGQGSVNAGNGTTTLFRTNTPSGSGSALSAGGGPWFYEVLTAPSTVTTVDQSLQQLLSAPWSDTGLTASNTGLAGRMAGSGNANFWAPGTTNSFVVVGWNLAAGSSWSQVAARLAGATRDSTGWSGGNLAAGMFVGATTLGFRQAGGVTGSGTIPTPLLFSAGADAQGVPVSTPTDMFTVVPEPTSFALAGLGMAAVTIFRRRK